MSTMRNPGIDDLLATPLFADVDKKLLDGVRKEAAIADGTFEWPPGVSKRAGFVRFVEVEAGDAIVRQGEFAPELFVVLAGRVEGVQAIAGRPPFRHRVAGRGDWFGEASAHSHHPSLCTWRAVDAVVVAAIEARLFGKLYAEDEELKNRIDASYRESLPLHLRATTLFRDLDDQALATLQQGAQLLTVDDDDVVAAKGSPADTVYLVRAGAIACHAGDGRDGRVLAFYKGNATFGEHAVVADGAKWPGTYRAMTRSALIAIGRQTWNRLQPTARTGLTRAANRLVSASDVDGAEHGSAQDVGKTMLDELFVMVERESVKGGRALVIDKSKCVRCNMCVESCVAVHDDQVPRLSKVGPMVAVDKVLITACYHCEVPQCMLSCDYAAIRRDPQGRIRFEYDNCVGCAGCIDGCPYGVIRLVENKPQAPSPPTFFQRLPLLGRLFGAPATPMPAAAAGETARTAGAGAKLTPVAGKTIKCDLCAGLPFEACVYNCPTTAITRREPQSLFDAGGRQ